jgi:hypothetical protein
VIAPDDIEVAENIEIAAAFDRPDGLVEIRLPAIVCAATGEKFAIEEVLFHCPVHRTNYEIKRLTGKKSGTCRCMLILNAEFDPAQKHERIAAIVTNLLQVLRYAGGEKIESPAAKSAWSVIAITSMPAAMAVAAISSGLQWLSDE